MDIKLISDFRNGEPGAFEKIYMMYSDKITRFICSLLKSESDAEDLTQSIFIRLWENRESFNPKSSLDGYMFTIARNTMINFINSNKRHLAIMQDTAGDGIDNGTDDAIRSEEIIKIMDAKAESMPGQSGAIYKLSQLEGLTPEKIAEQLNLSTKTVRNQLALIFKELRKVVDNYLNE